MLNFSWASQRNNIENIGFRNTYTTGRIAEDQGNGKYKVEISDSDKDYPEIRTIETDPSYEVGDNVGILWEHGNREKPVVAGILRDFTYVEVSGSVNALGV